MSFSCTLLQSFWNTFVVAHAHKSQNRKHSGCISFVVVSQISFTEHISHSAVLDYNCEPVLSIRGVIVSTACLYRLHRGLPKIGFGPVDKSSAFESSSETSESIRTLPSTPCDFPQAFITNTSFCATQKMFCTPLDFKSSKCWRKD